MKAQDSIKVGRVNAELFYCKAVCAVFLMIIGCGHVEERTEILSGTESKIEYTVDRNTDLKQGFWREFDKDGQLVEEAHYHNDTLQGKRKIFFPDGSLNIVETYDMGVFDGPYRLFYSNGNINMEGYYVDGTMEGKWYLYYPSGALKESVTFKDNLENGPFLEFYPGGKMEAEGTYLQGDNEHGPLILYDSCGMVERRMECDHGVCLTVWTPDSTERK